MESSHSKSPRQGGQTAQACDIACFNSCICSIWNKSLLLVSFRLAGQKALVFTHAKTEVHNFRHSLVSYLVRSKTDPKTVQALLRHSDVKTTLQSYSHSVSEDRMLAQGSVLQAILASATDESGLSAD